MPPAASSPLRGRLRLAAVLLLGLLGAAALVLAVTAYFFPVGSAVVGGVAGALLAVVAVVYGVLARLVARRSRPGHIAAVVVCVLGAVLSVSGAMGWPEWLVLAANLAAAAVLLGCVPRRPAAA